MKIEAARRLERIIDNLKSETAFNDQYAEPKALVDRMAELHTPAVSIAIIDDYQVAAAGAYGLYEVGSSRHVTEDTLFLAGYVECTEGGLFLQYDTQPPVLFEVSNKLEFFSRILNTELSFEQDSDGVVTAMTVKQDRVRFKAEKCQS